MDQTQELGPQAFAFGGASLSGDAGGYGFGTSAQSSKNPEADLLYYAYEKGVRVFDTAPVYGFGRSEEVVGQAFGGSKHSEFQDAFIITKGGVSWSPEKRIFRSNQPDLIRKMLEESLTRLRRDQVDCYMIHWPDPHTEIRNAFEVLKRAQEEGLIKCIGFSNPTREELAKAQEVCNIDWIQKEASIFACEDLPWLQELESQGKKITTWGTLDKGILAGTAKPGRVYEKKDARSWAPWWDKKDVARKQKIAADLSEVAADMGLTQAQLAFLYVRSYLPKSWPICGCKSPQQVDEILEALYPSGEKVTEKLLKNIRSRVEENTRLIPS